MDVFFADDSRQKSARKGFGELVGFGGLAFDEAKLASFGRAVDRLARRYGVPAYAELKWSPDRRRDRWLYEQFKDPARHDCYAAILRAAADHGAVAIVAIVDTSKRRRPFDAFDRCVDMVWETLETHLQKADRLGLMIADRPGGGQKQEQEFLDRFLVRQTVGVALGTDYKTGDRIQLNVLTTPSNLVRHLQVADLVVGATTGLVGGSVYAIALADAVKPLLRNAEPTIGAVGLRVDPVDLGKRLSFGEDGLPA